MLNLDPVLTWYGVVTMHKIILPINRCNKKPVGFPMNFWLITFEEMNWCRRFYFYFILVLFLYYYCQYLALSLKLGKFLVNINKCQVYLVIWKHMIYKKWLIWKQLHNITFNSKTTQQWVLEMIIDLVYFTTRVPDTNDTSATRAARVRHEWDRSDTSATRMLHERHHCSTSETFWFW